VAEPVFQRARRRLARGLENGSIDVKQPAVIAAPNPSFGNQAELQRGTPMRTVQLKESHGTPEVAEHDEILSQDSDPER
jgi:hypothetical protein